MTKSVAVALSIRKLLDGGEHPVGARLPSERELCVDFNVSRTVLREALAQLEAEGKIWRNVGQGTFVGGRPVKSGSAMVLASALTSPSEVMEVRSIVEPQGAYFAALRATKEDIDHLQHCLSKLNGSPNHANYGRWDSTFHRAIMEAAHNSLLLMLFDGVNEVRKQSGWNSPWERMLTPNRHLFANQHGAILQAIASHDPTRASQSMEVHLRTVNDALLIPKGSASIAGTKRKALLEKSHEL